MKIARICLYFGLLLGSGICFGQTTQPATEPSASSTAVNPAAALKAATDRASARFADTDQGRALAEQVTAAEKARDDARASGSTDDLSSTAMQLLSAKSAYDRALRAELDADPDVKAAAAAQRVSIAKESEVPALNRQILDFAIKHIGTQVGDGECWTLADAAMRSANATHPATYVWGRALGSNDRVFPGDIIQFTTVRLQNGTWWEVLGDPNHTAIVREVKSSGVYVILHQNYGKPGKVVSELTVNLNTKTAGEFVVYRPGS
jgi:hypothetical protein